MGNSNVQKNNTLQLNSNVSKYLIINKQANKTVIQLTNTNQTFLLIQHNFNDKKNHDRMMDKFRKYASIENINDNVLSLTKIQSEQYFGFCSTSYKISAVYEFPSITLQDQIRARQNASQLFDENDLWSILQSCINGFVVLKPSASINPSNVFILSDGVIKVAHNDMLDQEYRFVVNQNYLYAPEKLERFNQDQKQANLRREGIFSLGMTVLSAALLEDLRYCYDYKNCILHRKKVQKSLQQCQQLVSEGLFEVIKSMIQFDPQKRLALQQLQQLINDNWKSVLSQSGVSLTKSIQKISKNPSINQFSNDKEYFKQNRQIKNQKDKNCQTKIISHIPLSQLKNNINYKGSSTYSGFSSSTLGPYIPQMSVSNGNSQQNIFTDPKLLYMIRQDLKDYTERSSFQNTESLRALLGNQNNINQDASSLQSFSLNNSMKFGTANFGQLQANINKGLQNQSKTIEKIMITPRNITNEGVLNSVRFQGELVNDKKQGFGRLMYSDGSYYVGYFKNNQMHGQGQLYYGPNRPIYQGGWKNNKFDGFGIQYSEYSVLLNQQYDYQDFSNVQQYWVKFQGNFSEDMKNGKGALTLSNGEVFEGSFKNDMIHGQGKWTNLKGKTIQGLWQNNHLISIKQYV